MADITDPPTQRPVHYMTITEVAKVLRVHTRTLKEWRDAGYFPEPHVLGGNILRYRSDIIDDWMISRDPLAKKKESPE